MKGKEGGREEMLDPKELTEITPLVVDEFSLNISGKGIPSLSDFGRDLDSHL